MRQKHEEKKSQQLRIAFQKNLEEILSTMKKLFRENFEEKNGIS